MIHNFCVNMRRVDLMGRCVYSLATYLFPKLFSSPTKRLNLWESPNLKHNDCVRQFAWSVVLSIWLSKWNFLLLNAFLSLSDCLSVSVSVCPSVSRSLLSLNFKLSTNFSMKLTSNVVKQNQLGQCEKLAFWLWVIWRSLLYTVLTVLSTKLKYR